MIAFPINIASQRATKPFFQLLASDTALIPQKSVAGIPSCTSGKYARTHCQRDMTPFRNWSTKRILSCQTRPNHVVFPNTDRSTPLTVGGIQSNNAIWIAPRNFSGSAHWFDYNPPTLSRHIGQSPDVLVKLASARYDQNVSNGRIANITIFNLNRSTHSTLQKRRDQNPAPRQA